VTVLALARSIGPANSFWMPGWDQHSWWGWDERLEHFYAELFLNGDDHRERPRIWMSLPTFVATTVDSSQR
jgi:hypothetical protein